MKIKDILLSKHDELNFSTDSFMYIQVSEWEEQKKKNKEQKVNFYIDRWMAATKNHGFSNLQLLEIRHKQVTQQSYGIMFLDGSMGKHS